MDPTEFVSHFEELRKRLIICIATFLVVSIGAYFFSHEILNFLTIPLNRYETTELFFTKPYEAFLTHLKVSALTGVLFSSPVLFTQIWLFVSPGLYPHERSFIFPLIFVSILLFLAGTCFAYFVIVPLGLHFLLSYQTDFLKPLLGIAPYFNFLVGTVIAFGVLFVFPVFVLGLVKLGVVGSEALRKLRKVIIVCIFIAAAVLTPSPEPVSQILLALPLIILFEISLFLAKFIEKKR